MNFYRSPYRTMSEAHHHLGECPRCGDHALEILSSYAHCVNCLYFHEHDSSFIPIDFSMDAFERSFRMNGRVRKSGNG